MRLGGNDLASPTFVPEVVDHHDPSPLVATCEVASQGLIEDIGRPVAIHKGTSAATNLAVECGTHSGTKAGGRRAIPCAEPPRNG